MEAESRRRQPPGVHVAPRPDDQLLVGSDALTSSQYRRDAFLGTHRVVVAFEKAPAVLVGELLRPPPASVSDLFAGSVAEPDRHGA